jgi:agmatine deiminase
MKPWERGLSMPAEWAPHAGCWMAWPQRAELWRESMEAARDDYVRVAQAIARFEPVTMLAAPEHAADAQRRCGPSVQVVAMPIDDSWCRDSGPTFLTDGAGGRSAALFGFNAWGEKFLPYAKDAEMGARIASLVQVPGRRSDLVVEGGGFCSDGEGTLITAETCVLNPNRNPGWTKAQADAELRRVLGMDKIIWLPGDITDTSTDGHVDGYVAYFKPAAVLFETVSDPADPRFAIMAENRKVLQTETDAHGRRFELVPIAEAPRSIVPPGADEFCRSYVNFYIANGAIIAPAYGVPLDDEVARTLRCAYPDREVVMLPLKTFFIGGGGIHCITQQEPLGRHVA